ncbi:MAG: glycosyltransferase family 4 protein [Patescibacteria group bacterium]
MTKLLYIANLRLPTDKAHGIQIMKSCEAFAQFVKVELLVPRLIPLVKKDPFSYYGVRKDFTIKKIPVFEVLALTRWIWGWLGYVQSFSFSIGVIFYLFFKNKMYDSNTILYSRDYMTLFLLALFKTHPVAEIHDYRSKKPKRRINFIFERCRRIIVNSEGTLQALQNHYPDNLQLKKAQVVSNGVDFDYFNIKETKEVARQKLGIDSSKKIIGYLGRLETVGQEKGVSEIIQSFLATNEDALLYIVGGPEHLIKKYKQEFNNNDKVVFSGQVDYSLVPLYLRSFDAVIVSTPEGQHAQTTSPMKLFEYLASGKVIIAPKIPTITKYLNDNNSILFDPNPVRGREGSQRASASNGTEALSEKMKIAIYDTELVDKLSQQSLHDAKNYSWHNRAKLILDLIK